MRVLLAVLSALMSALVCAENTLPVGCQAIRVQGEAVTIKAKHDKLIYIHNLASNDLWITHPVTNPSASAGWSSRLQAGNWSALALDKGPFELNCIESKPGHEQQIPCEGSIVLCQWKGAKFPKSEDPSTFWVAEDMTLAALTAAVGGRGFVLPEPK